MTDRLYTLLPAVYRIRDAEEGEPLRALLGILEEEFERLERDTAGLYDDLFIETSAEWVVPYLGDLLGVRMLHTVESSGIYSQRAFVANTLGYRRRKGTLAMLEDLARDVTGWGAHAVAFFELLGWTQHLNHLRYETTPNPYPHRPERLNPPAVDRVGTVNLRSLDVVDRVNGPFDVCTHTVDVRRPVQHEGWHNIRNLGFFLWRLQSYPISGAQPAPSQDYADGFHFSPRGQPAPLFTNPLRKPADAAHATERNVAAPIRPLAFFQDPAAYYGDGADHSLAVYRGGPDVAPEDRVLVPVEDVLCKDLSAWSPPPPGVVAVDVRLGRIAFAPGETPANGVTVDYHYGFSADLGGGPYDRRTTIETATSDDDFAITVAKIQPDGVDPLLWRTTIADAIADWDPTAQPRAVLTVADNATYDEDLTLSLEAGQHLVIQADNRNRPTLRLRDGGGALSVLTCTGGAGDEAILTLGGLLIEGSLRIDADSLGRLEIRHCTLVPGRALGEDRRPLQPAAPSLDVDTDNGALDVSIESSITGALRMPAAMGGLTLRDSILDRPEDEADPAAPRTALAADDAADDPGPPTTFERVTVFGTVYARQLTLASEVLFTQAVRAQRRQAGCVRFSYVDDLVSVTPRRFRCQPDLALEVRRKQLAPAPVPPVEAAQIRSRMRPDFNEARYGQPAYAQLSRNTAEEVRTGAEDGSEMGVFEPLKQPQREANLRVRLDEYMPYGLEAGIIYVT
ncbi:MAG: hypothetical protein R3247_04995 [Rhodothermales bacterium]|nr:hypothetical protein [Rhodothermales bacterium]